MQDFVDLERLPFNRDYKGILGNIMAIRKMKRPRYKTRLNPDIGGSAQKYSMVPGRSTADSRGFLWTSEVEFFEQNHLSVDWSLAAEGSAKACPAACALSMPSLPYWRIVSFCKAACRVWGGGP